MSEKSRLVKNTGLIAIGNFGAKMVSFLLLPLYTSILTTSEYGTYDFIVAISAFLLPVVTMSMHEAMFRFIIDTGNKGKAFRKIISNSLIAVLFGIAVLGIIMYVIHMVCGQNINLLYIWIYVAASSLYTFSNNMLRGLGKIKEYAIISSGKNILQLILNVLVVAVFRWGMQGLLFSLCVSELLSFIIVASFSKLWKYVRLRYISREQLGTMLKYSCPLIPNALCAQIINISDRLIISGWMGTAANGVYSVSYKFPNIVETIYHYFYTAWSESASRVFAKGKEKATQYYQSLYDLINNLIFSIILLMTAGMPILFRLFIKGDYIQGFYCVPMLLFAMYFDCIAKFYSGMFTALKKTKILATSTIIAAIFNIVINVLLINRIGLYAAAGSTLVAEIILVIFRKKFISKDIEIKMNYKRILIEFILTFFVVSLYNYDSWIRIGISIIIAVLYAIVINWSIIDSILKKILVKLKKAN